MASSQLPCSHKIHVLAIPYPAQGHINPLMQLCLQLIPRGFTITFVNTEHNHARLLQSQQAKLAAHPQLETQDFRLVAIPGGLPPELHGDRARRPEIFKAAEELGGPVEQLLERLMRDEPSVSFILSDVLLSSWTQASANKFGIPRVAFWSASAATFSALCYFSDRVSRGLTPFPEKNKESIQDDEQMMISGIPGLPPIHRDDLPLNFQHDHVPEFLIQYIRRQFQPLVHASWVLVNSFTELESRVIDALSSTTPICAVGPLLPAEFLGGQKTTEHVMRPSLFQEDEGCLAWLDKQKPDSVLYISFGSISVMSADQFLELAIGLEASQQPFLWVNRPNPVDGSNCCQLPEGFLDRTKDKGLVVSWVPQLQVLSHPSVGGFLTHCGWNSVVESISMGVPMLCWPDTGERRSNGRFTVDVWKVGKEFKRGGDGKIGRGEVERVARALMEGGAEMRAEAAKLKGCARAAAAASSKNMERFVDTMKRGREHTHLAHT